MSGFWMNHVELYDEIIVKEMVHRGLANKDEEPDDILKRWEARQDSHEIADAAERDYWADQIDAAMEKDETCIER